MDRRDQAPTWRGATTRGLLFALLLFPLAVLVFKQPIGGALFLTLFAAIFYIPLGYFTEQLFWRRRMAKQARERSERQAAAEKGR